MSLLTYVDLKAVLVFPLLFLSVEYCRYGQEIVPMEYCSFFSFILLGWYHNRYMHQVDLTLADPCWAPSGASPDVELSPTAIGDDNYEVYPCFGSCILPVPGTISIAAPVKAPSSTHTRSTEVRAVFNIFPRWATSSPCQFCPHFGNRVKRDNRAAKYTLERGRHCLLDGSHGQSSMALADSASVPGRIWGRFPGFDYSYKQKEWKVRGSLRFWPLLFQSLKHVDRDENPTSSGMQQLAENIPFRLQYSDSEGRVMRSAR